MVAPTEAFEAFGDQFFDPLQVFVVVGLGAQHQRAWTCRDGALAPVQAENAERVGPFGVLYLRALGRVIAGMGAAPVTPVLAHVVGVAAQLDEISARAAGLDVGFSGQQGGLSFLRFPQALGPRLGRRRGTCGLGVAVVDHDESGRKGSGGGKAEHAEPGPGLGVRLMVHGEDCLAGVHQKVRAGRVLPGLRQQG